MSRFVSSLVALAIVLASSSASAQEPLPSVEGTCAPEVIANRRAMLVHQEEGGMWFHLAVSRCMLTRLQSLPLYVERVQLLEERLQIGEERTALLRRQVSLAEEGEERALGVLEASETRAADAEKTAERERSLRWVWFGVGVIVVVAVEALALWAWSALSE